MLVKIELYGRVKVTGPEAEDLTPSGSKVIALLALVCVSGGTACSRDWLKSILWSDRSVTQAQDSLRQAIASLKKYLGKYDNILIVGKSELAIDRSKTLIDVYDNFSSCKLEERNLFLAGLSVKDKKFSEWMLGTRQKFKRTIADKFHPVAEEQSSYIAIGISPIVGYGEDALIIGQMLIANLTSALRETGAFSIYDYSGELGADCANSPPDVMLVQHITALNGEYMLSLALTCVSDRKVIWNTSCVIGSRCEAVDKISVISIHYTDQIANALNGTWLLQGSEKHNASKLLLGAVDNLFSLSGNDLNEAERALTLAIDLEPKGIYYAWYAYLMAFRFEESIGENQRELKSTTLRLVETALSKDGCNALVLGLVAHVLAFIFRDFNRAEYLLERAIRVDSGSTLPLDSLALLNFYKGDLSASRKAAIKVYENSLFSPYRFCFATTLCMIDTMNGDFKSAVNFGELAISMHRPDSKFVYPPTLRYLSVAQAESGNQSRAKELFQLLSCQEPDFHSTQILEPGYPMPSQSAAQFLSRSLKLIETEVSVT